MSTEFETPSSTTASLSGGEGPSMCLASKLELPGPVASLMPIWTYPLTSTAAGPSARDAISAAGPVHRAPAAEPGPVQLLDGGVHLGSWQDEAGNPNVGAHADVAVGKYRTELGDDGVAPEVTVLSAEAGCYANESTTGCALQADAIEFGGTIGDEEENLRLAYGVGPGFGARLHHGDADRDGIPESGFGFDVGPVSLDVKSETLGLTTRVLREVTQNAGDQAAEAVVNLFRWMMD